jgi:anaerobic dimethyl sulfoxide reductase subunit A
MLCDKLGFGEEVAPRTTTKQLNFNTVLGATVVKGDIADREPLVSVTEEDLQYYGVTGEPQEGLFPIREFMDNGGIYHFQRSENDNFVNVYDQAFREDPAANPVNTPSGKYEIYCQRLKDYYDMAMFNDIDALPKYKPAIDGYEQSLTDPTYPFQLISHHQMRQVHSMHANVKQLNELFPNDLLMSEYDAQKNGFQKGDWVVASVAEGGKVVRRLNAVPFLMPGIVLLGEGNWQDIDQSSGMDIGANANTISRAQLLGDGYQAYNTILVKIEKYTGSALLPDYKRPLVNPVVE